MPFTDAFQRVEPGQTVPAPPKSLQTWTQQTTYGLLGGMLFGGYRGLRQSRDPAIPSPVPSPHPAQRAAVFFVRESILTGSRIGLFVSMFSAAALTVQARRCVDDAANYATAGAITCALFGGGVGGWMACIPAGAFGALTAGGAKMLQDRLKEFVSRVDEQIESHEEMENEAQLPQSSVARVVDMYEASLAAHPLRVRRNIDPQTYVKPG